MWIIAPVLPLAAALLVLGMVDSGPDVFQAFLPDEKALVPGQGAPLEVKQAVRNMVFYKHYLTYLGVSLFHVAACLIVFVVLSLKVRTLPPAMRLRAVGVFLAIMALLVAIGYAARVDGWDGGLNFGYRYICAALDTADLSAPIFPANGWFEPPLSRFAFFALVPLLTGITASALTAAVASTAFRPMPKDVEDPAAELAARAALLQTAFQATAFVLVTSVLTQVAFYRLPLPLIEDETALALMTGFAQSMSLYWGVVFTMTIVAMFGPGTLSLHQHLSAHYRGLAGLSGEMPDLPKALQPDTLRQRVAGVLTALAPLLIGASGSILETIAEAL
jgi:hypothetical protein